MTEGSPGKADRLPKPPVHPGANARGGLPATGGTGGSRFGTYAWCRRARVLRLPPMIAEKQAAGGGTVWGS